MDPIQRERNSGLEIQAKSQLQRVGTLREDIQENSEHLGKARSGLLCLKNNEKAAQIYVPKSRSELFSNKCTVPGLGKLPIPLPTILPNGQGIEVNSNKTNPKGINNSTTLARPALVLDASKNVNGPANALTSTSGPIKKSHGGIASTHKKPHTSTSGLFSVRKQLEQKGISTAASEIMLQSRRASTTQTYEAPWGKWVLWCQQRSLDPTNTTKKFVIDFLTELFEKGLEYRTINVYRSAISAYHLPIDSTPVGQIKEVCQLLSGMDNIRPATPKYSVIWEVQPVIDCLKNLGEEERLSNKDLTLKTVMLMALTAIKRCSDLHILDVRFMATGTDKVIFQLNERPKNFKKKGGKPDPIIFSASGESLCPVSTIKAYIERTKPWREANSETKFFLSFIKPHKSVKPCTIGRWLKTVLANGGIDTSKFTAHSTRAAASSKMKTLGATVAEIMNCGNWNSSSTWQRFYNRQIESSLEKAQKAMLG